MREILFRGKKTVGGEWVEGSLIQVESESYTCILRDVADVDWDSVYLDKTTGCIDGYADPVEPETVGQFTELYDVNGKKIFEGDIVRCIVPAEVNPPKRDGVVKWARYGWVADFGSPYEWEGFREVGLGCLVNIEVIGSIHDK